MIHGKSVFRSAFLSILFIASLASYCSAAASQSQVTTSADSPAMSKQVGSIQSIHENTATLTTESGSIVDVVVPDTTRVVQVAPGQTDLKAATPVRLQNLEVGDRMLVCGKPSEDGKTLVAVSVLVMKQSELARKQEQERQDWEKHGVGGLVTAVDPSQGKITLSSTATGVSGALVVNISKTTVIRRYAPDSVKFNDAKPGTLADIKVGDQLRARGSRSGDGKDFAAVEIVSGSFKNIAGTISSVDAGQGTIIINDIATRKPITVSVTSESSLRKLPPRVAQMIAMRLKGTRPGESSDQAGSRADAAQSRGTSAESSATGGVRPGNFARSRADGPLAIQQILSRMPSLTLADIHKGDEVIIVATQGNATSKPTAITLLRGVEPILTSSPNLKSATTLLSPWNLSSCAGESAAQ